MAVMTQAQVLYDNWFNLYSSTLTYNRTPVAGFEPNNAVDWRDFSLFLLNISSNILEVTAPIQSSRPIDTLVLWFATPLSSTATITLEYSGNGGSTWNQILSTTLSNAQTAYPLVWIDFVPVSMGSTYKLRITISGSNKYVRQIAVGRKLTFPIGQWADIAPPTLYSGVVLSNVIAENGSILGRNVRRAEKKGELSMDYLDPTWVRGSWDPFAIHAARYPFFYRWDPANHTSEVAFAAAESIQAPRNSSPPPYMSVSMPMRIITP